MRLAVRAALIFLGGLCMLAGLDAALMLLGLPAPLEEARIASMHGILMVLGFLGTVISLERAVALRRRWALLAPLALGGGSLLALSPAPAVVGQFVLLAGCVLFVGIYGALWQRAHDGIVLSQLTAAVLAVAAVIVWMRTDVPTVLILLSGFLVVTIAAERVELARLTLPPQSVTFLLTGAILAGVIGVLSLMWPTIGGRAFGIALGISAWWLLRNDVAKRTIKASGLVRFSAAAMIAGYIWLLVAAIAWLLAPDPHISAGYDTIVHAVFLGFGVSMVMAHAPVILPSVLGIKLPYHRLLWVPLVILHVTLAIRVVGTLATSGLFKIGGVGGIVALLVFVLSAVAVSVNRTLRTRRTGSGAKSTATTRQP